jgi:hypothetical protein
VRRVGDECLLRVEQRLELGGHLVERRRQGPDLGRAALGSTGAEVAGSRGGSRAADIRQWGADPAGEA